MNRLRILLATCLISTLMMGCTSSSKDMFDANSKTTKQVMQGTVAANGTTNSNIPLWSDGNLAGFTRDQANELDNMFPVFPNPTVYLYVDPHITKDGLPVPGYTTKFKMFRQDHYALPSEIMGLEQ